MANLYEVWHRTWDGTVWSEITDYIQINTLEFSDTIDNDPFTFGFNVHDRLKNSDAVLAVEDGDYIAVINTITGTIAENGKMVGKVDLDANLVGADWENKSTKPFRFENDITVKEYDFSDNKLHFFPDPNTVAALKGYKDTSLNTILTDILLYSGSFLGVQLTRYSGVDAITKFVVRITDYDVKSFKAENKSTRQAFIDLMNQERLFFKVRWFYETDATYGLNLSASLEIFDKNGIAPFHPSWSVADVNNQSGVTDEIIRVGKVSNPTYASSPLEPRFYYCCKDIDLNTDKDIIRNYILIEAVIVENEDAFVNDDNALTRYTEQVDHAKQFNYTLPFPALDIKYVGFLVRSKVTNGSVPTTTTFDVPSFDTLSFNYDVSSGRGDIVRVYDRSGNVQAFREVSNVSGNTITLSSALPFTPAVDDIVENVQPYWLTIYEDREEDNNSFGVVKEIDRDKSDQEAKLRFLDLSEPPPPVELVVYYYKAFKYKDSPFNQASINRYGMKTYSAKLDGIFTKAQIKDIGQRLLILEPNKTVDMVTYRPIEAGTQVNVNITGFVNQTTLPASTVRGRFGGKKEEGFLYTEYEVTLSELKEDIEDIIRRINNQYKSERSSGEDHNRIIQEETIHVVTEIGKVKPDPTYTETLLYASDSSGNFEIYQSDMDGSNKTAITANGFTNFIPTESADGLKIAYSSNQTGSYQIWIYDRDLGTHTQITNGAGTIGGNTPDFSPDGTKMVFASNRSGNNRIYTLGVGESELLGDTPVLFTNTTSPDADRPRYSPDGSRILYQNTGGLSYRLYTIDSDDTNNTLVRDNYCLVANWAFTSDKIVYMYIATGSSDIFDVTPVALIYPPAVTTQLTTALANDNDPCYTLDDSSIYFEVENATYFQIWKMDADGSNKTQITNGSFNDYHVHVANLRDL